MRIVENQCVGCETCTLGSGCPLLNVAYYQCDQCENEEAQYCIDDNDLCYDCAVEYLCSIFKEALTIEEMAEVLQCSFQKLN